MTIRYRAGYKYQLHETFSVQTPYRGIECGGDYLSLDADGLLTLNAGYSSDGPSGPTIDTKTFMRGAFAHDALYQFMRSECIPLELRDMADKLLREMCIEDGMCKMRAAWVYYGLKWGGAAAADPRNKKEILEAP